MAGCGHITLLIILLVIYLLFSIIGLASGKLSLAGAAVIGICTFIIILIFGVLFALVLYALPIVIIVCIVLFLVYNTFK